MGVSFIKFNVAGNFQWACNTSTNHVSNLLFWILSYVINLLPCSLKFNFKILKTYNSEEQQNIFCDKFGMWQKNNSNHINLKNLVN